LHAAPAGAQDYTDLWWNPNEPGWGVNVVQSNTFMFVTFFIYGADKKPTWYTANLTWDGSKYTGPLFLTNGTYWPNQWNAGDRTTSQVGSATFTPSSLNAYQATLSYNASGLSATKSIERQPLTAPALGGSYIGGQAGSYASCSNSGDNGPYIDSYTLTVTQSTSNLSFAFVYDSGATCTLSGSYQINGQLVRMPGATYVCTGNLSINTNAVIYEIRQTGQGIEGRFDATLSNACRESASFSAAIR